MENRWRHEGGLRRQIRVRQRGDRQSRRRGDEGTRLGQAMGWWRRVCASPVPQMQMCAAPVSCSAVEARGAAGARQVRVGAERW